MSLNERQQAIINLLLDKKEISLNALGNSLHYSQATLRRDVATLESEGLLRRSYGKIHWIDTVENSVPPINDRTFINSNKKRLIAKRAAELIPERSTIILDSGTTTSVLAQELKTKNLTIVTNSLEISFILAQSSSQVISCGGLLQPMHLCFLGPDAEHFLSNIEAEILFLGASGIRNSQGLTTSSPLQYNIKKSMIRAAKKRVVLVDLSKFDTACLFMFSDFSDIDTLITLRPEADSRPMKLLQEIESRGVEVIFAD